MSISHGHRKQLTQQLLEAFAAMSATEWEYLGHELAEHIVGEKLRHRGLTVTGNPSGYSVDSYSANGRVIAEYGTDPAYFADLSKPKADYEHARREAPQAETILLLSNRVSGQKRMLDVASWLDEVRASTGIIVDVYDARELTEVILDDVLPRGCASKIAPFLEPIARLMKEQAASHRMPAPRPGAVLPVEFVERIQSELDARRVVLLSGMSGLGKTELAVSISGVRELVHDRVVWVDRPRLRTAADLEAVDVAQVGMLQNLRGMLTSRSCFLVLDDIRSEGPLSVLLDELTAECGPDARLLITSQVGTGDANDIKMEFLEEGAARALLEQDVDIPCPDDLFAGIWQAVNGHPMTLQLLNASAREAGGGTTCGWTSSPWARSPWSIGRARCSHSRTHLSLAGVTSSSPRLSCLNGWVVRVSTRALRATPFIPV